MDPLLRLGILMWRLVHRPPARPVMVAMLVALLLSVALVLVERFLGWPEALQTHPVPLRRLAL
ncbi:hypothetical protein E0493_20735 [Roseomonas sp. M0104]|uniref:Uncharacterized protein n=1 Tax=Teichococcus coralli TaxID=2545983 RepID=A0A845BF93_9PROT|nr:hypothetical protein [Pseudoroseomonas coralli]MXP65781.1 hypothetical protein [Pseudoroseomonas coralli]